MLRLSPDSSRGAHHLVCRSVGCSVPRQFRMALGPATTDRPNQNSPPEQSPKEHRDAVDSQTEMKALQLIPLQKICSDSKLSDLWTACDEFNMVSLMGRIAVLAAVLGVGLIMLIAVAGRVTRFNRRLLVVLFSPRTLPHDLGA